MITIGDLEHLGPALGILRRRADLMQKEISTHTGMSRSQVSRYERGRDVPNLTTLIKYLEVVKADFQLLHRAIMQVKQDSSDRASGLTPAIDPLEAASLTFLEPLVERMFNERVQHLEERLLENLLEETLRSSSDAAETITLNELLSRLERVEAVLRLRPATASGPVLEEEDPESEPEVKKKRSESADERQPGPSTLPRG